VTFDLGLTGQRALVTGGTKGIGAAVVATFRAAGVRVVTTARVVPSDRSTACTLSLRMCRLLPAASQSPRQRKKR